MYIVYIRERNGKIYHMTFEVLEALLFWLKEFLEQDKKKNDFAEYQIIYKEI